MASTLRCLRNGTSALTESASSLKSTEAMPVGETMSGVPSRVIPTKAIFTPPGKSRMAVRREDGLAAVLVGDVGGEEREVGAVVQVAVAAAIDRVAAIRRAGT